MSVAFAREDSAEAASETVLPARPISDRVNLVTASGLELLQAELTRAQEAHEEANRLEDVNERRRQSAVPLRDARYFAERIRTAELQPAPASNATVAFGHTVTFEREDGRRQTFRIVGEDEADPAKGTISHGSPVAIALMGKAVGDLVQAGRNEIEIVAIAVWRRERRRLRYSASKSAPIDVCPQVSPAGRPASDGPASRARPPR